MSKAFAEYRDVELQELVYKLHENYYSALQQICDQAMTPAVLLHKQSQRNSTLLYASLSVKLIEQIEDLTRNRVSTIVPYLYDLARKNSEGHDCRNCTGKCRIGHADPLLSLKSSHKNIKEILYRLHTIAIPLYSDICYPEEYSDLRNNIAMIDFLLTKLFFIEEAYLIPSILNAQQTIHAGQL